jgi:hypothetical protein
VKHGHACLGALSSATLVPSTARSRWRPGGRGSQRDVALRVCFRCCWVAPDVPGNERASDWAMRGSSLRVPLPVEYQQSAAATNHCATQSAPPRASRPRRQAANDMRGQGIGTRHGPGFDEAQAWGRHTVFVSCSRCRSNGGAWVSGCVAATCRSCVREAGRASAVAGHMGPVNAGGLRRAESGG